jgi:enamine deaminase RidA (YjgF/YER057c/UK114 family)
MKTLKLLLIATIAFTTTNMMGQEKSATDLLKNEMTKNDQKMYVIEREIPGAGDLTSEELKAISQTSCGVLHEMGSDIKWLHSYVTGDKIYCVYMAQNEDLVREHAQKGGFPANSVAEVKTIINPDTAVK